MNLSIQSTPFGSSLEYTKQENASLNSPPHGPWAIPPKQGQSQFISPVSSLKAPSDAASSSSSAAGDGESSVATGDEAGVSAMGDAGEGTEASRVRDCD